MNATPPEARAEYSRAKRPSKRVSAISDKAAAAILGGVLLGAVLLLVAELTTLYEVRIDSSPGPIKSVGTGSHHAYALVPIAVLAAVLAYGTWRERSRSALLAVGVLGIISLLIALLGDLPDAHTSGLIQRAGHYINASSTAKAGLYMETLGSAVLILTTGLGLLLAGTTPARDRSAAPELVEPRSAG